MIESLLGIVILMALTVLIGYGLTPHAKYDREDYD
jgi:hypothetical protein